MTDMVRRERDISRPCSTTALR